MQIHCPSFKISSGRIFSYPTRLLQAQNAGIMEFFLPQDDKLEHDIEVVTEQGSTKRLGILNGNRLKRFYRAIATPISVKDTYIFDSRYETDGNIAHILTNVIPQVLVCQRFFSDVTVVLRTNATTMSRNIYQTLGIPTLYTDRAVYGNLLIPRSLQQQSSYETLYPELFADLTFDGYRANTPERIFIARKNKRRLLNEDEVAAMLQDYGFQKVYFEDISIAQQWSLCRNAKVVVGLHGAAIANLVFNPGGFKLIELFHPGYIVNMYRNLTHIMGGRWVGVAGQITPDVVKTLDFEQKGRAFSLTPTKIDLTSLEMALNYLRVDKTIPEHTPQDRAEPFEAAHKTAQPGPMLRG